MQDNDFQLDDAFPSEQVIDTYTVGFTTSAVANELLDRTATAGNGEFFFSNNAEELTEALTKAITAIVEKSMSFTAATVPASRTTDGDNFYTSFFLPKDDSPFWEGHLKNFAFTQLGDILRRARALVAEHDCPLDPIALEHHRRCRERPGQGRADGILGRGDEIPAPARRNLYVSYYPTDATSPPHPLDPDRLHDRPSSARPWASPALRPSQISAYDTAGRTTSPASPRTRSWRTPSSSTSGLRPRGGQRSCQDRAEISNGPWIRGNKLWDTFHSNPVVVGPPNRGLARPRSRPSCASTSTASA